MREHNIKGDVMGYGNLHKLESLERQVAELNRRLTDIETTMRLCGWPSPVGIGRYAITFNGSECDAGR
jgi:hypothetical protein